MNAIAIPLQILLALAAVGLGLFLLFHILKALGFVLGATFNGVKRAVEHVFSFVGGEVSDVIRVAGGFITTIFYLPAILANVAAGRWSAANHYGKALEEEALGMATAVYRVVLGRPASFLGLSQLTDGFERRIPAVVARAPGADLPRGRPDAFEGYTVEGALPVGGSGARLYLARPGQTKRADLLRNDIELPAKVVIKSFSLADGSTMPQIVRESRALDAARELGLVYEHELTPHRFHYVMPFVDGDDLNTFTHRLHARAGDAGLGKREVAQVLNTTADLLVTLSRFHGHGLWHKDIKPSNIIVSDGEARLVDIGLTTPLRSAMTLTTHGTEYFRDPEMVRLALRGVKVHEVDGVKFDIYGAGAVLFSMLENSFPAHGSLSQITRTCPEALRWVVRRAMADMGSRYPSADAMLRDVQAIVAARDPFKVRPVDLPSMQEADLDAPPVAGPLPTPSGIGAELRPRLRSLSGALGHAFQGAGSAIHRAVNAAAHEVRTSRTSAAAAASAAAEAVAAAQAAEAARSSAKRRRRRSGLLAAGLLAAVLVGGVVAAGALFAERSRFPLARFDSPDIFDSTRSGARAALSALGDFPRDLTVVDSSSAWLHPRVDEAKQRAKARMNRGTEARWQKHRPAPHTVLVVGFPLTLDETGAVALQRSLADLEAARFQLVGAGRPHGLDAAQALELEAEAKMIVGTQSTWDDALEHRLQSFLAEQGDHVDAIVGLNVGDHTGRFEVQMVAANETDRQDLETLLRTVRVR